MICSSSSPPIRRRPGEGRGPRGFTLVELLVVILILAVLIALLLPAINGALRTAKNAAVGSEINQLAQALVQFKSQYGVFPPSRLVASENGNYDPAWVQSQLSSQYGINLSAAGATALSQRSVQYLRRIWPRMVLNATSGGGAPAGIPNGFYDFDGSGTGLGPTGQPKVALLQGTECLVFFLGGLPETTSNGWAVSGFAKNPANPMQNAVTTSNRSTPMYEFVAGRFVDIDNNGFPEYLDGLGGSTPRPYAYFSAYEGQGYDPDDNNYLDPDDLLSTPPYSNGVFGGFSTPNAPTGTQYYYSQNQTRPDIVSSEAPNPYTVVTPINLDQYGNIDPTNYKPIEYVNKNTFQIFSAGLDNDFGIGGCFNVNNTVDPLTFPATANSQATGQTLPVGIRLREHDNVTNFNAGTLD